MDLKVENLTVIFFMPHLAVVRRGRQEKYRVFVDDLWMGQIMRTTCQISIDGFDKIATATTEYASLIRTDSRRIIIMEDQKRRSTPHVTWKNVEGRLQLSVDTAV